MAITANVTNGKLDKTNTTPTQNRKTSSAKASGSNLGYDDFLKLLSAEMQYQDPLEPTSNTDYVAQMATFSQLEATLSMKESMSSSYDQTTKSAALSLVGKEVIVTDKDSASGYYSGKVDYSDTGISYVTNGQNVPDDIEVFDTQKIVKQLLGGRQ